MEQPSHMELEAEKQKTKPIGLCSSKEAGGPKALFWIFSGYSETSGLVVEGVKVGNRACSSYMHYQ